MKKNYLKNCGLAILMLAGSSQLGAQISGTVTINSAGSGTTNYTSFSALATALNGAGINGPLTVNVLNGPYVEQFSLNAITGASSVNRITINGNNQLLQYNPPSSGSPWVIGLNGTDYLSINNLNVESLNQSWGFPLKLWAGANYNMFTACGFTVPINATSTQCIPVSISGSGNSYSSGSMTTGDYNKFIGCKTFGGYAGFAIYRGTGTNPFTQTGWNEIIGCTITDFYYAGVWNYAYENGTKILNNTIKCPTRTNTTSKYGIFCYGTQNTVIDGNFIHELFGPSLYTSGSSMWGIYCWYNTQSSYTGYQYPSSNKNIIRNNIIADLKSNGQIYGIEYYYADGEIYNNTISLDHTASTSGSQTYGMYTYGYTNNYWCRTYNNIVTITRGGSGTKYCYYNIGGSGALGTDVMCDRNDFYITSAGNHYIGYYTGLATTHAQFQSQGGNTTGWSVDPQYANLSGLDMHPTNSTINNGAMPAGLVFDQQNSIRNGTTPDIGALEFLTPLCTGTPTQSVAGPMYSLCPGESADFSIGGLSSDNGYTYQWYTSTFSQVGPWTPVSAASPTIVNTTVNNIATNMWVSAVISCTAPGGASVQPVATVNIMGPTVSNVPYHEGFEMIGKTNRLPNCSWLSPSMGNAAQTHTQAFPGTTNMGPNTGTCYAAFQNTPPGTNLFYSNGINLIGGITYSASVWYKTNTAGSTNWTNFGLLLGTAQVSTGLTQLVAESPANSANYKLIGNTFSVATSGVYYVAVRATSGSGGAPALSWDDLRINIPCGSYNPVSVSASANTSTICLGQPVTLTGNGADVYSWSTGETGVSIVNSPNANTTFYVTGTNSITNCSDTRSVNVIVYDTPNITLLANNTAICPGKPVSLQASGAATYSWSVQNMFGPAILVYPTTSTNYSVMGSSVFGCVGSAYLPITVFPNLTVTAVPEFQQYCAGDPVKLIAGGASTYQWSTGSAMLIGNPVYVMANPSAQISVIGTDVNGCQATSPNLLLNVEACTGLKTLSNAAGISVYPNPANDVFNVSFTTSQPRTMTVTDLTGRTILSVTSEAATVEVNLGNFAAGVYYMNVDNGSSVQTLKLIRN
jgi:hypothetical protein